MCSKSLDWRSQSSLILHCTPTSSYYSTMINVPSPSTTYTTSCISNIKTLTQPSQVDLRVRWTLRPPIITNPLCPSETAQSKGGINGQLNRTTGYLITGVNWPLGCSGIFPVGRSVSTCRGWSALPLKPLDIKLLILAAARFWTDALVLLHIHDKNTK